jgi:hypothetical protein
VGLTVSTLSHSGTIILICTYKRSVEDHAQGVKAKLGPGLSRCLGLDSSGFSSWQGFGSKSVNCIFRKQDSPSYIRISRLAGTQSASTSPNAYTFPLAQPSRISLASSSAPMRPRQGTRSSAVKFTMPSHSDQGSSRHREVHEPQHQRCVSTLRSTTVTTPSFVSRDVIRFNSGA